MNVLIITEDKILSRMLLLEISAFGANVREERGLSEDMVYNIFWNNAMGVMRYAVQDNTQ